MIDILQMAGLFVGLDFHGALSFPETAPLPIPAPFLAAHSATEPVIGQEMHVMYHFIVPTEPFANVRMIASQTTRYAPGHGQTLEHRKAALTREATGLRNQMLEEAEILRRDLTDKAFTITQPRTRGRSVAEVR